MSYNCLMKSDEVRRKYLEFFKASPRNHKEISPAPLVPENDPTTLFTSSGMQQLVPYLMGEAHPEGKRLVDSQPSLRVDDIDEVGNTRHLTFFEMLGNWSLGDYFKEEQLAWVWEFFTKELSLPKEKLWVSVFEGDKNVSKDNGSFEIWKKIGVPEERIKFYGADKNWWSRSGTPDKMPANEVGGPDSEIFFEFGGIKHNPKFGKECHPNCDCGRFLEIGNSVFIQYKKGENGELEELPQKNVDFGGGLERIAAATEDESDVFKIDVFTPFIKRIEEVSGKKYSGREREMRIIADHIRASEALIKEGVVPSNKLQGYVLRRLIRRSAFRMKSLKRDININDLSLSTDDSVNKVIEEEASKFVGVLERGEKLIGKIAPFDLYQSYGLPVDVIEELYKERKLKFNKEELEKEIEKHKELSRSASGGMFKGGLADHSEEVIQLHTATHLIHAALRKILGDEVSQKGSNITAERLRFDFTFSRKLTSDEIKKVEDLVNSEIDEDLVVSFKIMSLEEAKKEGALAFFGERYGEKVKVYSIGDPPSSREVCGGPHVKHLSEIRGHVKITKEELVSSGVRRVYASIMI